MANGPDVAETKGVEVLAPSLGASNCGNVMNEDIDVQRYQDGPFESRLWFLNPA